MVFLVIGFSRLRLNVDILNLLPTKLTVVEGLKQYEQHFSNARELIITLEGPTPEATETAARGLAQVLREQTNLITSVIWQSPYMEDPAQTMELLGLIWLNQTPTVFGELTNRLAEGNLSNTVQEARERLTTSLSPADLGMGGYDPYGFTRLPESISGTALNWGVDEDMFASPDKTFRLLFVEARPNLTDYQACQAFLVDIRRVTAQARNTGQIPSDVQVHYTGRPAFVSEISLSMQNDLGGSSAGVLAVIGILFWLTHRRLLPLVWLLVLLFATLAGTLGLGGLFMGTLNIVSLGFASILLGLAEDFGILIYQESRSHPELSASELRHEAAPGIWWSAVTTAGAFLMLNLSALPGLGELGSMVALGIVVGAFVMLYGYTPLVVRFRRASDRELPRKQERLLLFQTAKFLPTGVIWLITVIALVMTVGLLWRDGLRIDNSPDPLKQRNSEAFAAMQKIKRLLTRSQEPLWVLVPGQNETEVGQRLGLLNTILSQSVTSQMIAGFTLPTVVWPHPENQQANRLGMIELLKKRELLRSTALQGGFTTNAFFVTEYILNAWQTATGSPNVYWPTSFASKWLLAKCMARSTNGYIALGVINPTTNMVVTKKFTTQWPQEMQRQGILLSGYNLLGSTVFDLVLRELPRVVIPVFLLVALSLWLAFRNIKEVALSLATLGFSGLCLVGVMGLLKWEWNLLNVMGLPLLLGMGVDFSIHIQLALRRYQGDLLAVRRSVGRALLLAGSTTVAGFGALALSSNAGMASLGLVCALGITLALLVAVYLLPVWWKTLHAP